MTQREHVAVPRSAAEWYVELDGRSTRPALSDTDSTGDASFAEWLTRSAAHETALERCEAAVALARALADEPELSAAYADAREQAGRMPSRRRARAGARPSFDWAAAAGLAAVAVAAALIVQAGMLRERHTPTARAIAAATAIVASNPLWNTAAVLPGDFVVDARALAVLPLTVAGEPQAQAHARAFATALDRELVAALRKVSGLYVVNAAIAPAGAATDLPPSAIGMLTAARGIVVGSVRGTGSEIEVDLTLLDAASDTVLWQGRYHDRAVVPIMADAIEHIALALVAPHATADVGAEMAKAGVEEATSARNESDVTSFDRVPDTATE